MMQSFDLYMPTRLLFGKGRIAELGPAIRNRGKKVLFVTGGNSIRRSGLHDRILGILADEGCSVAELAGVTPNPDISQVRRGVEICRAERIDLVLAAGGGSVLDAAKAVAAGALYPGDPWDLVSGKAPVQGHLPIFTVITLAATGSEFDDGGVISNAETREKLVIEGGLIPEVSIADPEYTLTVPPFQTAAGAADILSHVFEQYFVREGNTLSDGFCEAVVRTVVRNAPVAVADPGNYEARAELLAASSFGCCGLLSIGRTRSPWPCHAIEHELSAWYGITHGAGLAVITPAWMRLSLTRETAARFARYGEAVFGIREGSVEKRAGESIRRTGEFFRSIGLPSRLSEFGITDEHFGEMADHVLATRGDLHDAFVPLGREGILRVLRDSL